jgi:hypothetical protein
MAEKIKKFSWNKDNSAIAVQMYQERVAKDGKEVANSDAALGEIAAKVGAVSPRSVRGKLSREGVYDALDPIAKTAGSTRLTKVQYVRSLAKGLNLDLEDVSSLDKANIDALEKLTEKVSDTLVAAGGEAITVK